MSRLFSILTSLNPRWVGIVGAALIMLGSFGAGATRTRGGLLVALHLEFLSYGHGQAISGTLLSLGTVIFITAWVLLGRQIYLHTVPDTTLRSVRTSVLCWLLPLIPADPILSRDVFSYLMQGVMVRGGFDPYTEGASVNPGPMLLEVSRDWRNTTTPYGPLHLWISESITSLVGDNVSLGVLLYKALSLVGFIALCWAIPWIAAELGGSPTIALWLSVANPLMVFHLVGGMHNESVMVALVSIGILAALRNRFALGVATISVAVALKATAAIALPFIVWIATHYYAGKQASSPGSPFFPTVTLRSARTTLAFFLTAISYAVETVIIVATITVFSGTSWGWLSQITGNSKVINPLALPTLLAGMVTPFLQLFNETFEYNTALNATRTLCMLLMAAGLILVWWRFRQNRHRAVWGIVAGYAVAFVFNSVTLPWYYASIVSLMGVQKISHRTLQWTVGLSIIIALSFTGNGNHQLYNIPVMLSITLLSIAGVWWITVARKPSPAPCA